MREILTISIGQAGIQLGEAVWQQYCVEHKIDTIGSKIREIKEDNSYLCLFEQTRSGHVPRNLMIDSEPNVIDNIRCSKYRQIFHPEFLLSGHQDATNFARGYYSIGTEMIDIINDRLRKLTETSDNVEGFLINRSVGGGTGSGLGSLILEQISVNYRKKLKIGFEIYPSPTISTCVIEPYNALLATHCSLHHIDISIVLDNEAIYEICQKWLDLRRPSYGDLNNLIRKPISSITSGLRFLGELNCSLNAMQTNLVPFPRLHMMITSFAPVITPKKCSYYRDVQSISESCFSAQYFSTKIADFDAEEDKYMAISMNYHGNTRVKEANATVQWLKTNKKVTFVEWMGPTAFKIGLNDEPMAMLDDDLIAKEKRHVAMIGNNTAISRIFSERISKKYDLMYSQKAFIHWFNCEGMNEAEFDEAREDLGFLEKDYLDVLYGSTTSDSESNSD